MRLLYLLIVLCLTGTLVGSATADAATFTVSSTADAGAGTLRQAILDANANGSAVTDEIAFSFVMPTTITPASQLPSITTPTVVNGRDLAGCTGNARGIQIDGGTGNYDGLTLASTADGSRICSLNVRDFGGVGIVV